MHQGVIGEQVFAAEIERRTMHVRDGAAGLAYQQHPAAMSHGFRLNSQKQVQAPACDVSQVDRGRSRAPHPVRKHRELIVEMHVHVLMPFARGKAGGRERILDPRRARNANAPVVQKCARAGLRAEHLIAGGIDNDAAEQFARTLQASVTLNTGNPCAKLVVPSSGSTYQRYSDDPARPPPSSATMECVGK